jgi:hypothetical protein
MCHVAHILVHLAAYISFLQALPLFCAPLVASNERSARGWM